MKKPPIRTEPYEGFFRGDYYIVAKYCHLSIDLSTIITDV